MLPSPTTNCHLTLRSQFASLCLNFLSCSEKEVNCVHAKDCLFIFLLFCSAKDFSPFCWISSSPIFSIFKILWQYSGDTETKYGYSILHYTFYNLSGDFFFFLMCYRKWNFSKNSGNPNFPSLGFFPFAYPPTPATLAQLSCLNYRLVSWGRTVELTSWGVGKGAEPPPQAQG